MNLSARLSLDTEQLHGSLLVGREAAHLPDHVPRELGVLGEVPVAPAVSRLANTGHLVALVEVHSHGVAQGPGCGQRGQDCG